MDFNSMNPLSHLNKEELKDSCKTRLLARGGQLAVADKKGLIFLQQKYGQGTTTMLDILKEKYFTKKPVTDFVEYERDKFLVCCLGDTHFHLLNRQDKKIARIRSLNADYVTLGVQMMPQYEL